MTDTALMTDMYELTMVDAALKDGTADRHCVFELFARRLRGGRRYGVVTGTGRFLDALKEFRFDVHDRIWLKEQGIGQDVLRYLEDFEFKGNVYGIREGDLYFPGTPVLTIEGTFAECCLLETLALSIFNYDSAVATAASRMVTAAQGRPLIEMGSRRANEDAAVAAARAAYIAGFGKTSNLLAGRRYGIPVTGTSAHAFTLLHDSEQDAFNAQTISLGSNTTYLVDTYDIPKGIEGAVKAATAWDGSQPGAIRLDSGDMLEVVPQARKILDGLGCQDTRIIVTGDMNANTIAALASEPVDGYGVGTSLVTGDGYPTAEFVYKLVEVDGKPVEKKSSGKATRGGRKTVWRNHTLAIEILTQANMDPKAVVKVQRKFVSGGKAALVPHTLEDARKTHTEAVKALPAAGRALSPGNPIYETVYV